MEIKGKVHCFFEQSGMFKNEFIKLGIPAEDYDIQNNFGETDHEIDLFAEIESAYGGGVSVFDTMSYDDLIMAFFPCIHFCELSTLNLKLATVRTKPILEQHAIIIERHRQRDYFFGLLHKMVGVCRSRGLRLVFENPYNGDGYLQRVFEKPTIIDKNRMTRGDYFVKPTGYWFYNCEPTYGCSFQNDKKQRLIAPHDKGVKDRAKGRGIEGFAESSKQAGICSEGRSMISPDYARNFICDFIIGKKQAITQQLLFD